MVADTRKEYAHFSILYIYRLRLPYILREREASGYSKCHVTSNKAKSNLECAEEKFQTRGWGRGVGESGRTSVLPPQAMRGI
jgi:hypothetical protein